MGSNLVRRQLSKLILDAKQSKGVTFEHLARTLNVNKVWLVSSILGEHPMPPDCAERLLATLELSREHVSHLTRFPEIRGDNGDFIRDPVVYRFHELVNVYGPSLKMLVQEECGDGIMSAIDCGIQFDKHQVGGETRIKLTIDGKFLSYKANN